MKERIRIEVPYAAVGTKVLKANGEPLAEKITSIQFSHDVGKLPQVILEMHATETVIEGEVEVTRVVLCPCCKKQLDGELAHGTKRISVAETTGMADEYRTCIAAPKDLGE